MHYKQAMQIGLPKSMELLENLPSKSPEIAEFAMRLVLLLAIGVKYNTHK